MPDVDFYCNGYSPWPGATDAHLMRLSMYERTPDTMNVRHGAQFSVSTRLKGFARYGGAFDFLGEGHFFGQIGEIRISSIKRY